MSSLRKSARLVEITDLIRRRMDELELDRVTLAARIGGNKKQVLAIIHHWVRGDGAPGPKYVERVAEVLGVDADQLRLYSDGENDTPPQEQEESKAIQEYLPPIHKKVVFTIEGDFASEVTITIKANS